MAPSRPQTPSGNKDPENQPVSPKRDTDKGSGNANDGGSDAKPPPLPPRPQRPPHGQLDAGLNPYSAAHKLQSGPTTALSLANVNVQALDDVTRENYVSLATAAGGGGGPEKIVRPATSGTSRRGSRVGIDIGDNGSVRSFMPESDTPFDAGSVFGDSGGFEAEIPFRNASMKPGENQSIFNAQSREDDIAVEFEDEFDSVDNSNEGENEGIPMTPCLPNLCRANIDRGKTRKVEEEEETFFHTLLSRETYIYPPWRWWIDIPIYWYYSNHHFVLPRVGGSSQKLFRRKDENRDPLSGPLVSRGHQLIA